MLALLWEEGCSKWDLLAYMTHGRAITYLWLKVQKRADGSNGERVYETGMRHQEKGEKSAKWKKGEVAV